MKTNIKTDNGICKITFSGRMDTIAATQCMKDIQPVLLQADKEVHIDCKELEYVCSSGLRIFLILRKAVSEQGGRLVLSSLSADVMSVFTITGFIQLFDIQS